MSESVIGGERAILISPKRRVTANQCFKFYFMAKDESDVSNQMVFKFYFMAKDESDVSNQMVFLRAIHLLL